MSNQAWRALEGHRSRIAQVDENSTRPAWYEARYTTTGLGVIAEEAVFAFDMAFLDMPTFTYGAAIGEDVDLPDTTSDWPTYQAGVYRWQRNGDGLYTGAWAYFSVAAGGSVDPATFSMDFTLMWAGIGSKHFLASRDFPVSELEI